MFPSPQAECDGLVDQSTWSLGYAYSSAKAKMGFRKGKSSHAVVESMAWSMRGREKGSFGILFILA